MRKGLTCFVLLSFCFFPLLAQQKGWSIVFYNTENLYDTRNDSLTMDDEFTPRGEKYWTRARYVTKLLRVAEAVVAAGGGDCPLLVGLAEVENRRVLQDLIGRTSLADGRYGILHRDSPDVRGIDVALLYRRDVFQVLDSSFLAVPLIPGETTREILYCKGIVAGKDTLHCFVCHFPSMRGGERQSEWKRERAASVLLRKADSIQQAYPSAAILIMGDFNGTVGSPAQKLLRVREYPVASQASRRAKNCPDTLLYDLGYPLVRAGKGSYRYRGRWQLLDRMLVSGSLLNGSRSIQIVPRLEICDATFLLEEDRSAFGMKPFRTYAGPRYLGGYSDHLPVALLLRISED